MKLSTELSKLIIDKVNNTSDFDDVVDVLQVYAKYELKGAHLGRAFEKMYVREEGFSPSITMEELKKYHHSFHTTNGGNWCRSNQNYLGKKLL